MLVVETIAKIRRDHLVKGVPIKKLARDLRVSKNTIRKVVRGDATSHSYERKIQPMPKLGLWVEELERQLKANEKKARKDRLSLLRIHEDLVSLGYKGGYDAVRRYARAWRRRWRLLSPPQAYVPLIFDPGEAYQFDWSHEYARLSGATTRVKAAHMRLCHSRMYLVQIFPRESCQRRLKIQPKGGAKDCHLGWRVGLGVRLGVGDAVRGFFGGSGQRSHAELKRSAPAGRPQGGMVYRVGVGLATRASGARCRPGPGDGVPQFSYRHCFCGRGFG